VYAHTRSAFDVGLLAIIGAAGYALRRAGYPLAPIVFGAVLGALFEDNLRRALLHSRGELWPLFEQHLVLPALAAAAGLMLWRSLSGRRAALARPAA
jgi:putative tricarboxylic transport membrane protein